jgi:hypothetical protein
MIETISNSSAILAPTISNNRIIECINENASNKFLQEVNINHVAHFQVDKVSVCLNDKNLKSNGIVSSNRASKLIANRISNNRKIYKKDQLATGLEVNGQNVTNEKLLPVPNSLNSEAYTNNRSYIYNRSDTDSSNISNVIKISIDTDQTDYETGHEENYTPKKTNNQTNKATHQSPSFNKSFSLNVEDGLLVNENASFTSSEFGKITKEIEFHKETVRNKPNLKVQDLSLKLPKVLERKMMNYPRLIISLSTFYTLPVVQLILLYQTQLNKSGNEDSCYFNFLCMIRTGPFAAFK